MNITVKQIEFESMSQSEFGKFFDRAFVELAKNVSLIATAIGVAKRKGVALPSFLSSEMVRQFLAIDAGRMMADVFLLKGTACKKVAQLPIDVQREILERKQIPVLVMRDGVPVLDHEGKPEMLAAPVEGLSALQWHMVSDGHALLDAAEQRLRYEDYQMRHGAKRSKNKIEKYLVKDTLYVEINGVKCGISKAEMCEFFKRM